MQDPETRRMRSTGAFILLELKGPDDGASEGSENQKYFLQ